MYNEHVLSILYIYLNKEHGYEHIFKQVNERKNVTGNCGSSCCSSLQQAIRAPRFSHHAYGSW